MVTTVTTDGLRRCSKCGEEKLLTKEFFYENQRYACGFERQCKSCRLGYMANRWLTVIDQAAHKKSAAQWLRDHPKAASKHKAAYRSDWVNRILNDKGRASLLVHADIEHLWLRQSGRCFWTGVPLRTDVRRPHPQLATLDRLEPTGPYAPANVVLASFFANMGRQQHPMHDTREFCALLRISIQADTPAELAFQVRTPENGEAPSSTVSLG
jgi:hypothetical protein